MNAGINGAKALGERFQDAMLEAFGNERVVPFSDLPPDAQARWNRAAVAFTVRLSDNGSEAKWRPIETAPRDGTPILTCNSLYTENGFLPVAVRWRTYHPNAAGDACFRDMKGHKVERVQLWRPLPAPPDPHPSTGPPSMSESESLVERMAEAAWRGGRLYVGGSDRPWTEMTDWVRDQWRASARAMLETMREPTVEMLIHGHAKLPEDNPCQGDFREAWEAAIDAALA